MRRGAKLAQLIEGDNLLGLSALLETHEQEVTLAYLDPPFFTGRVHERVHRGRDSEGKLVRSHTPAFDDRWSTLSDYLEQVADRVALVHRLLAPHGSLVLHVDPKTSHYLKVVCDEIFGGDCFASEIIWRYRRWPARTQNFQRVHDVLLRYVKDPEHEPRFNQCYEALAASTLKTWGTNQQRAVIDADGRRVRSSTTQQASKGVPMGDVWDIGIIAPVSKERTGYPTQKPEALVGRLIDVLSSPQDIVVDPYAGSGTTLVVAAEKGRRSIGIDQNQEAIDIASERLRAGNVKPMIYKAERLTAANQETARARSA